MSAFEFVFSLFGLLLGFSLVQVLGGLARVIEAALGARHAGAKAGAGDFRAGWLTPLFGIFVMLDILSFWISAWLLRDQLQVTGATMIGGLLFASAYYLAAHLVIPDDPGGQGDLDAHYFRVRRVVLGPLIALALIQIGYFMAALPGMAAYLTSPRVGISVLLLFGLMIAAMLVRSRLANALLLVALSLRYLIEVLL
ncbi:MAG TPA: hypothetical protein VMG08_21820 [Allosphingosinicella sp.]|nr:hypothetical protein [Allosphingosinicella sp.]